LSNKGYQNLLPQKYVTVITIVCNGSSCKPGLKISLSNPKYTHHAPIKNADMCVLYCIMQRVTKSRKMRLAGHVAQMGEKYVQGFGGGNLKERDNFQDLDIGGKKILKGSYRNWRGGFGLDSFGSGLEEVTGLCATGIVTLCFLKYRVCLSS